jgi:hypothetical protein
MYIGDDTPDSSRIVLKRHSHSLRAVHAMTGEQRWNVSVAEHRIEMADGAEESCAVSGRARFAVLLPDSEIVSMNDAGEPMWKQTVGVTLLKQKGNVCAVVGSDCTNVALVARIRRVRGVTI